MAELSHTQRRALSELEQGTPDTQIREIRWDRDFKSPKFIAGTLSAPSQDDPERIARRFLGHMTNLVALPEGVNEQLDLANITTDAQGYKHVTFQQVLNGVPVFEGSIQVHIDPAGRVVSSKANRAAQIDVSMTPTIPEPGAIERARQELGEADSSKVPPTAQLMLFKDDADRMYLAWHVRLFSDQDMAAYHYFLDAHTGRLLYKYNDLRHVMARETYTADNQESLPGQLIIREADQAHADQVAWDAHANAGIVYNYYREHFGRDSYDNQGSPLRSTVHFSRRYNNAFWTSELQQMVYGDGDMTQFSPLSGALDVVAHELTHAVTSSTARFVYAEEAGALDEAFADFFGVMISNGDPVTNWKLGEEVFTPGRPGDALRDISNPPLGDQPDHTDTQSRLQPGEFPECNPRSPRYNDNGFVHTNSGIPNKAGFLMVAGGTHHGITVQPLGKAVAEAIMYLALTVYLESATPSRWTFRQAMLATLDACRQLYPGDDAKLASVTNAWAAVGVGEPAGPAPTEPTPTPTDNLIRVEATPRLNIPDATPSGVTSVLTVPGSGSINSVKVAVDITHSYIGDLQVALVAPSGMALMLHQRSGASRRDIVQTYDAVTTPGLAGLRGSPVQGDWRLVVSDHARRDVGQLRRWSLEIAVAPGNLIRQEVSPGLAIPDNNQAGIRSPLTIAQTGSVQALKVWVDITHTWIGDLRVDLILPSNDTVTLHNRTGDSQQNLIATFDRAALPALGNLVGQGVQGNWQLKVADLAGRDVGKLNRWGIEVTI
jgi:Zn-dependent metalloprotease/subtilisin-like proprotein convertase family protein